MRHSSIVHVGTKVAARQSGGACPGLPRLDVSGGKCEQVLACPGCGALIPDRAGLSKPVSQIGRSKIVADRRSRELHQDDRNEEDGRQALLHEPRDDPDKPIEPTKRRNCAGKP